MEEIPFNEITVVPGQAYMHYKGNVYRVHSIATHTETKEELVIYHLDGDSSKLWARPMKIFMGWVGETVDKGLYQEIGVKRFTLTEDVSKTFIGIEHE